MSSRPRVLLATCSALPHGDPDDAALVDALDAAGCDALWQVWDDPDAEWHAGTTVLRSTWDYTLHRQRFLAWVHALPAVHNPAASVRWNSDKRYLLDLAAAGVPVTPTSVAAPGQPVPLPEGGHFVVKPAVGAGSRGAGRFSPAERPAALAHASRLHDAGRTVLVQPYLDQVEEAGETAVVAFAGRIDHAARKGPMLLAGIGHDVSGPSLFIEENISPRQPSAAEVRVAEQALTHLAERFGGPLLYARVDLLPSPDGPVVVEVEVVEPSLFFGCSPGSEQRYAVAIAETIATPTGP